ncbi:uncharacterized protein LOC123396228 [Hordeum vulgare subsp. vulgare]|uniref:uncharacterized protein LOC123396228 n=1 Tax=Hordeum vulgare subsp. vulgare TaxID=112509 RepID=UPI001D1A43FB|nr:uncharacterized protein LOC123396228 [Hordeum vulgare subsp. vulgare]
MAMFSYSCKEEPLTQIEKIRARTMMRNNRMFQSLGLGAIVSMIRKANAREDGSAATCNESASTITQDGSSDYNPKDDEVIDGEEVDDKLVKKKGKKVREDVDKSLLHKGQGPLRTDDELASMEEGSRMCMDLSPVAPSVVSNHGHELNLTVLSTEPEQPMGDEGAVDVVKSSRNGKGLEKLTRLMGAKVRIEIAEGMRRPEKPVQAAKLASEGGLIARAHMTLLPHFKEYKKNPSLVQNYIGKVSANFEMDTESSVIEYACTDILKNLLRNRRHYVKKQYFDNVEASKVSIKSPVSDITDTEWQRLVELWSTPRHKETCANNKVNRTKVKFAQKTGSRCYVAHQEQRKGEVLSALDIFKATHNSTKHGFSEDVQVAIVTEMEEKMTAPVQEGEERKSSVSVVAEPNSTSKSSKSNATFNARVLDLQEQLEMSRHRSEVMREEMDAMKRKAAEAEAAQAERDKSYELLLKKAKENDAKYAQLMALLGAKTGN